MAIETPQYEVLQKDGKNEIRQYHGYIIAAVVVESDFKNAVNSGFRILVDYIFGNNRSKTHIAMTVPVTEQAVQSEKIAMTAPVTSAPLKAGRQFLIAFTMPAKYTLENLPEPENKQITFQKVSPYQAAILVFRGYLNEKSAARKALELESWLNQRQMPFQSGFTFAQYNPPWIPGPFRRNEVIARLN
jgi:hypothetical protein